MLYKFIVAILLGYVLRYLGTALVRRCILKASDDSDLNGMVTFHIACISYVLGSMFKYGGLTLLFAYTIKDLFLT